VCISILVVSVVAASEACEEPRGEGWGMGDKVLEQGAAEIKGEGKNM